MQVRFAIGLGLVMVALEAGRIALLGAQPFWALSSKNFVTAALLLLGGWRARPRAGAREPASALLVGAWGFGAGQFFVSWLHTLGSARPLLFVLGDSAYLVLCVVGLIWALRSRSS